jgi:hypothetical protein
MIAPHPSTSPPSAAGSAISPREIERLRDETFRRRRELRLSGVGAVARFIDRVGFAFLYRAGSELPSVWEAIAARRNPSLPRHIQSHDGVGLAWEAKDVLAARKRIFYGKLLRRSPTLVSLQLFPAFYALSGNRGDGEDHLRAARTGRLSQAARAIAELLSSNPPLTTLDLKGLSGHLGPGRRAAFDRAMAELQERLLVVKYAEIYRPRFTFLWGPLHLWLPEPIAASRELEPLAARVRILERYLQMRWVASAAEMERLFGWPRPEIAAALARLTGEGKARPQRVHGLSRPGFAAAGIDRALRRIRREGGGRRS